jgi:hypothetical protein
MTRIATSRPMITAWVSIFPSLKAICNWVIFFYCVKAYEFLSLKVSDDHDDDLRRQRWPNDEP